LGALEVLQSIEMTAIYLPSSNLYQGMMEYWNAVKE